MQPKSKNHVSLSSVKEEFAKWRAVRKIREPIPERLWQLAEKLVGPYTKTDIVRGLVINHTQLLNRLKNQKSKKKRNSSPRYNFVEIDINKNELPGKGSTSVITIEDTRGWKIELRGTHTGELMSIAGQVWRGEL